MARILDGKIVKESIKAKLKEEVLKRAGAKAPALAIIQVGDNASSNVYIQQKINFGKEIGVEVFLHKLPEDVDVSEISTLIKTLNADNSIGGIIIQLPLPVHLNAQQLIDLISPEKDVDGLSSSAIMFPATAIGVMTLLDYYNVSVQRKKVLVIGRSNLVGKPTATLLVKKGAEVSVAHKGTSPEDLVRMCHEADIIIVATGVPHLIGTKHVLPHHVIVDIGISRVEQKIAGDVDFEVVKDVVTAVSPVPGGVGPLTVASLFQNLLR